jgi:peptidyl-prolyl cis-trans isomerase A (cyclophilin A)
VIEGWDEGIAFIKVGDKARFVIPSDLGYGPAGAGGVITKRNIDFDVELWM